MSLYCTYEIYHLKICPYYKCFVLNLQKEGISVFAVLPEEYRIYFE